MAKVGRQGSHAGGPWFMLGTTHGTQNTTENDP